MDEYLSKATMADAQFLLDSHNASRANFFNPKEVSWEEHKAWLSKQIKLPHTYICIVKGRAVGAVRATKIGGGFELHWEIIPTEQGKGYATLFTSKLASLLKGRLVARIKPENVASIKVAKSLGMVAKSNIKWEK